MKRAIQTVGAAKRGLAVAWALAGALLLGTTAHAAAIVVPNGLAGVEGNDNNGFPFNTGLFGVGSMRYQQVFDSSQFASLSGASLITQIAFRPDASFGDAFSSTLTSVQINLSTTAMAPDGLSATFASNVGPDDTVVFSGALTLSSADVAGPGGTRAFDIVINLTSPFLYNPTVGDLLLDVRNFDGGSTTQFDAHTLVGDSISRAYFSNNVNSPTANTLNPTLGLVTQFSFNNVPEPGTLCLVGAALAGLGLSRRGRRTSNAA